MDVYLNKRKLDLAQAEALEKGGDVKEIYLRLGGSIKVEEPSKRVSAPETPKKTKKK